MDTPIIALVNHLASLTVDSLLLFPISMGENIDATVQERGGLCACLRDGTRGQSTITTKVCLSACHAKQVLEN